MSMPMTCSESKKHKSAHKDPHREHLPHLIPRLLMHANKEYMQKFCAHSLESICMQYGVPSEHATVRATMDCIAQEMSFTDTLSIFFVLLNIDTTKIANFLMNLRKNLVSTYMSTNECTTCKFVTSCTDAWSVA